MTTELGRNLYRIMSEKKMSRKELHEKSGVSLNGLSKIIHGKTKQPDPTTIGKIADALEVEVKDLI